MGASQDSRVLRAHDVIRRNICAYRAWRGLTQDAAAKLAGVSLSTLQRWEMRGREGRKMAAGALVILAQAYGVNPGDFYADPSPPFLRRFIRQEPAADEHPTRTTLRARM